MKNRNAVLKAAVAAVFVTTAGTAIAGAITAPAAPVNYAIESLTSTTDVTLATVVYRLDVPRTAAQDFTIIYTLPAGYTFNATPAAPTLTTGGTGAMTCALKRGGASQSEVVYDCDVTATTSIGDSINLAAAQLRDVGTAALLGTAGNTVSLQAKLLEGGETACVDNAGTPGTCFVSRSVATSSAAVDFVQSPATTLGVVQDTGNTTTDVNAASPAVPLGGFVAGGAAPADTATTAIAQVFLSDNASPGLEPDGATDYSMKVGDKYTYTISDPTGFLGLATDGLCLDVNNNGTLCEAGEIFTGTGNTKSLTVTLAAAGAPNAYRNISYRAAGTTSMGTSRTIGIAGTVDVVGQDHALTGNASWWVWSSNGTQLQAPVFYNNSAFVSRFVLTNTGTVDASYSTRCFGETGTTATLGTSSTGTIPAGGNVELISSNVCTLTSGGSAFPRGTVVFTVNAPTGNIQGSYTIASGNSSLTIVSITNLMRPGTN